MREEIFYLHYSIQFTNVLCRLISKISLSSSVLHLDSIFFFFLVYDRRWYCLKNCSRSFRLSLVHKSFVCNNRKRNAKTSMRSEQNENYSSISFYNQVKTIELFHFFFSLSSAFGIFHIYIQIRRIRNIVDYFQFNCCNASALVI